MALNKIAFSLASLVVMLAFSSVAPSATAQFDITLSLDPSQDVSSEEGYQVEYGTPTTIRLTSTEVIQLGASVGDLNLTDFMVIGYNAYGGTSELTSIFQIIATLSDATPADGKHFIITITQGTPNTSGITRVLLVLPTRAELDDAGARKAAGKNKEASIELHYVAAEPTDGDPTVLSISKVGASLLPVTEVFDVLITLSEMPRKDGFKKDHIDASNATVADPVAIEPILVDLNEDGTIDTGETAWSGRDGMHHRYVVKVTPKFENKNDIVVKVKSFMDQENPSGNAYTPPTTAAGYTEGTDQLTVKVGKEVLEDKASGL
ncbi:hypothetical protein J4G07_13600, partial [Candidatus Poribacteria bacterium]|nr:hypothetical protein [Candidatus Poribacteria bacterium]